MTLGSGADRIDLYYFGAGHTSGDALVLFPALRIMHAGDLFAGQALSCSGPSIR
jgi:cyclase